MPTRLAYSEQVEKGDVVEFDGANPIHIKKATYENREKLAGAISTSPAIVFEGSGIKALGGVYEWEENKAPLALAGRIPVKVSLDNGPISIGDPITISSTTPGVGVKAVTSGKVIGYALENYPSSVIPAETVIPAEAGIQDSSGSQIESGMTNGSGMTGNGKILVFANLGYWQAPDEESSPSLLASIIDAIVEWLKTATVTIKNVTTDAITAFTGVFEKLTAKEPCLGQTCLNETQLKALLNQGGPSTGSGTTDSSVIPAEAGIQSGSQIESGMTDVDTQAPVITINGLNPTEIEINTIYSDMGVTVTDNINNNLGYKISLNGGPEIYPQELILDTSAAGEHTITYIATDQAGNTGTTSRTVIIYDPNAPSAAASADPASTTTPETITEPTTEPEPAPEPVPTSELQPEPEPEPEPAVEPTTEETTATTTQ